MKKIAKYVLLTLVGIVILGVIAMWQRDLPLDILKNKYAPAPSQFLEMGGMNVHYRDEGNPQDSLPIVLLHGTGASLHTWEIWVEQLRGEHRVIRMDIPAFGLTGAFPNRDYSIAHYVAFLHEFLEKLGVKRCILGGNSLGGSISWEYAVAHPTVVEKLILVDAAGYPMNASSMPIAFRLARIPVINKLLTVLTSRDIVVSSVKNVYFDKSKVTDALVDRYFELSLREGNRQAFVDRMMVQSFGNNSEKIKTINIPTLIIWGEQDMLIPVSNAYRFHDDLPNDSLVVFKNLGHVPMEEDGLQTVAAVKSFLIKN